MAGRTQQRVPRSAGWLAIAAAAWALALAVPLAAAWHLSSYVEGPPPAWATTVRDGLGPLLDFAEPDSVFNAYGRAFFVSYGLALPLLYALRGVRPATVGLVERQGSASVRYGLWMALLGTLAEFWGEFAGLSVLGLTGVVVGVLGVFVALVGFALLGAAALPGAWLPRAASWALVALTPIGLAVTLVGLRHVPTGPTVALAGAWLILGVLVLRGHGFTGPAVGAGNGSERGAAGLGR